MQVRTDYSDNTRRTGSRKASRDSGASASGSASDSQRGQFLDMLNEVLPAEGADSAELNRLWADLPDAQERLLNQPSKENLSFYKELIRKILSATLRLNTSVESLKRKGKSPGETVELHYVRIIDARLDSMAELIRSPRNAAFGLLKAMEGIRGILLDLRR